MAARKYLVWRILGNALPPRHRPALALDSLRFILEHEPELPNCEKRWLLNRIVDPETEAELANTLKAHGALFDTRPFDTVTYRQQRRAHDKIRYAIGINSARNLILQRGRRRARYTIPTDGGCYFSRSAWDAATRGIERYERGEGGRQYFAIPMKRLASLEAALDETLVTGAVDEPQVAFRHDSDLSFSEDYRYGYRDKVELLVRLGRIPGFMRGNFGGGAHVCTPNDSRCPDVGFILRLPAAEAGPGNTTAVRVSTREESIERFLQRVDALTGAVPAVSWETAADEDEVAADSATLLRRALRSADEKPEPPGGRALTAIRICAEAGARLGVCVDCGAFEGHARESTVSGSDPSDAAGRWLSATNDEANPRELTPQVGFLLLKGETSLENVAAQYARWEPNVASQGLIGIADVDSDRWTGGRRFYFDRIRGESCLRYIYRNHGIAIFQKKG